MHLTVTTFDAIAIVVIVANSSGDVSDGGDSAVTLRNASILSMNCLVLLLFVRFKR